MTGRPAASLYESARASRDAALEQVESASDPDWRARAFAAIRRTAETMREFISDDVWRVASLPAPREARALGPIFLHAVRAGWIQKTGRVRPSVRSHLSGKPIWQSLIFQSEPAPGDQPEDDGDVRRLVAEHDGGRA